MTPYTRCSARISDCGRYRYTLQRSWHPAGMNRFVCWVMLNPSTADERQDDPTIRRCVNFAKAWGYDGIEVVNLYAWRATKPTELWKQKDPVGPNNDVTIRLVSFASALTVCAWGNNAKDKRLREVTPLLCEPHALRVTKAGQPAHPLYLPQDLTPGPLTVVTPTPGGAL